MSRGQSGPQTDADVLRCYGEPVDVDCATPGCGGDVFDLAGDRECTNGHTNPRPEVVA